MPDNQSVTDLNEILEKAFSVIEHQHKQIAAYVASIELIGQQMVALHADTKITKIAVSVLLRECSNGDSKKLDRLLALSVARLEERGGALTEPVKAIILKSIDELVLLTES